VAEKREAEIFRENSASAVIEHMSDLRKASKRSDSPPIKSKFVESNLYAKPAKKVSNKENLL
jgi:hypothetical protein